MSEESYRQYTIIGGPVGGRYDSNGNLVDQGYGFSYVSPSNVKSKMTYDRIEDAKRAIDQELGVSAKK